MLGRSKNEEGKSFYKASLAGDCQTQGLSEWLQSLGWREDLTPADLRKLNTPKMRSIWRHLQAHVVPTQTADTIRKNVLLSRLQEENISVGQFSNFKLDSVSQLGKVKEIQKTEKEKAKLEEEIKMIDRKIESEKSSLLQNTWKLERKRYKLSEIEDKTMILELKNAKILRDCKRLNLDIESVTHLKSFKNSISNSEKTYQKSLVCKYVKNYRYPFKDTDDDSEYLCDMMASILVFKPGNILDGISHSAKEALSSLNPKVDITMNIGELGSSKKVITFQEKLKNLKILAIRKEMHVAECLAKLEVESKELEKEKEVLLRVVIEKQASESESNGFTGSLQNHCDGRDEEFYEGGNQMKSREDASRVLNDMLELIQEEKKNNKIWEVKNQLLPNDEFEFEDLKQSVISLETKESELWREVEKKVSEINTLTTTIFTGLMDSGELKKLISEMLQLALDFKTETSEKCKKNIDSSEFTEMILKEIEVFRGTPTVALQRKWNTNNEMLRVCSAENSSNPALLQFLLQSEEKNSVVNVLEKYVWSLYTSPQFH